MQITTALIAAILGFALALAADAQEAKSGTGASAPNVEGIKPTLKPNTVQPPLGAATAPEAAKTVPAPMTADNEAALHREVAAKLAERLAALRKEQAQRKSRRNKAAHVAKSRKPVGDGVAHWEYTGEAGPSHWGKLDSAWAKCDSGTRQSPIDIRDGLKLDLDPVNFDTRPVRFNVLDDGHTIQVNPGPGNRISVMGRSFELVQFHFHHPAEERIDGRGFPMVAHLVHKDGEGKLAVVSVLIEEGKPNDLLQNIWNALPLEKNEPASAPGLLDLNELLPERREYFTYMGSLTTPPCTEGVLWIVLKQPVQASSRQIAIFSRLYPMNARPLQALAGRLIKESN